MSLDDVEAPVQLGVGARFREEPSPALLRAFDAELQASSALFRGLSWADLAHVETMIGQGVIPQPDGCALLRELLALHHAGIESCSLDARWGDLYSNRDAELRRRLGQGAGWLHAGRARREAITVAWLLVLREACDELVLEAVSLAAAVARVALQHTSTLMPDFTYLQHAQPTTLGHYLLGFAYPVLRDAQRVVDELERVEESPAGSGSTNGSRLQPDRRRLQELLGFATMTRHSRDAMWRHDVPFHLMSIVVSLATGASRLAEELQLWATDEFGFVRIADRHCRTSVIMPNKRNPYSLSFLRGSARELIGNLVGVVATNQTPSGQIDNRSTSYQQVPAAIDRAKVLLRLLAEIVEHAEFDRERLARQASSGCTWATELADILLQREGIDARTAHEIVGKVVSASESTEGLAARLIDIFQQKTGRTLAAHPETWLRALAPEEIVSQRRGIGTCDPDEVRSMCEDVQRQCETLAASRSRSTAAFPGVLEQAIARRLSLARHARHRSPPMF